MPNNTEWNLQQHLVDMERRIREDFKTVSQVAEQASDKAIALDGRVRNLEEKAGWIGAGFGGMVVALVGIVWRLVTSGRLPNP
jgi:hypothetical protein